MTLQSLRVWNCHPLYMGKVCTLHDPFACLSSSLTFDLAGVHALNTLFRVPTTKKSTFSDKNQALPLSGSHNAACWYIAFERVCESPFCSSLFLLPSSRLLSFAEKLSR